jgi:two-component sensor histidine kinase
MVARVANAKEIIVAHFEPHSSAMAGRILLRELDHRIRNELACAFNLVSVAAIRAENSDVKNALSDVVELLHQHADVYSALGIPDGDSLVDAANYLAKLGVAISRSRLDRMNIELVIHADYLLLQSERCWRLGLMVNELLTNSARHACFDGRDGEIRVELARASNLINCTVSDNGSSRARVRPMRGLRIIKDLATTVGGRLRRVSCNEGTSFAVMFQITERELQATRAAGSRRTGVARRLKPIRPLAFRSDGIVSASDSRFPTNPISSAASQRARSGLPAG